MMHKVKYHTKNRTMVINFKSHAAVLLLCTSQYASTDQLYNAAEYDQAD